MGQVGPFFTQIPDSMLRVLLTKPDCLITDKEASAGGASSREPANVQLGRRSSSALQKARAQSALRKKTPQERDGRFRSGVELNFFNSREFSTMRNNDTVNFPAGRNRDAVDDPVNRTMQKFEAGNERNIQIAALEFSTKRRRMIEIDHTFPAMNQWAGVEIFNATDAQRLHHEIFLFLLIFVFPRN